MAYRQCRLFLLCISLLLCMGHFQFLFGVSSANPSSPETSEDEDLDRIGFTSLRTFLMTDIHVCRFPPRPLGLDSSWSFLGDMFVMWTRHCKCISCIFFCHLSIWAWLVCLWGDHWIHFDYVVFVVLVNKLKLDILE